MIEIVPAERKLTVPAWLSRTPVAPLVLTTRFETLNVPVVRVELEPRLGSGRAGVDDVDVVDRAAAVVAAAAGDAAAGALRIDVDAAHLVAVVEVDDVRVGGGERRVGARVRRVQAGRRRTVVDRGPRARRSASGRR